MDLYNTEDMAQSKLLILYILNMLPSKITNTELSELVLEKGYMNFFALQQYLNEMVEGELIEVVVEDDIKKYNILEKGILTLDLLNNKIPDTTKQELENQFKLQKLLEKRETQVIGEYFKKENEQYTVNLRLVENDDTLFSLYFEVATEEQGQKICNMWKNNTESIYQKVLGIFIKEDFK